MVADIYFEKTSLHHLVSTLLPTHFIDLPDVSVGTDSTTSYYGPLFLHLKKYSIRILGATKLKQVLNPLVIQAKSLNEQKATAPFVEFGLGVMLRHFARHPDEFEKWLQEMLSSERQRGMAEVRNAILQALNLEVGR